MGSLGMFTPTCWPTIGFARQAVEGMVIGGLLLHGGYAMRRNRIIHCCWSLPLLLGLAAGVLGQDADKPEAENPNAEKPEAEEPEQAERCSMWIDVYRGEPVSYGLVLDDLAEVDVVYLGEAHTIQRHHDMQRQILTDLAEQGVPLVLALEQFESFQQPELDKYNRGEIDLERLIKATDWPQRWSNYRQYVPIVAAARKLDVPVLALNARSETIRQVFRSGGVDKLEPEARKELPAEIQLDDPPYLRLLNLRMMIHATAMADRLRPMFEAQIARDEAMAETLTSFLQSEQGKGRTAIVLCGSGHIDFGLGTPTRVQRRMPKIKQRVVLLSASGDEELSAAEKAMAREINVTHEQLRKMKRPIGDYLYVTSLKSPPADE